MKQRTRAGEPLDFLLAHVNDPHGDDDPCVIWPFGVSQGYGYVRCEGVVRPAHAVLLELRDGPAPPRTEARHGGCHDRGCFIHVRWGSRGENISDKVRDGTSQHGERNALAKLTEADVRLIRRRLAVGESQSVIARDYPVGAQAIGKIARRVTWGWLSSGRSEV